MPLVPCESCRRHLKANETACPFCKQTRTISTLAVVAVSSALVFGNVSCGAKYGGPPPSTTDPTPPTTTASNASPATPSETSPTPTPAASSARIGETPDSGRIVAPAAKYGAPPRN